MTQPAPNSTSKITEAAPAQVQAWLNAGEAILVDVREPDEHAREHIRGSTLLPLSSFDPARLAQLARPGKRVVLHCKGGKRSADACRMAAPLAASGVQLFSLAGGIEAWKQASLPVELNTSAPGISVMRQVQLIIGVCVLAGSALAWLVHPGFIGVAAFFGAGLTFAGATGTCALATLVAMLPWNRAGGPPGSCSPGGCN